MIAMRSSGDSSGPMTPLPRGPSLNSWPALLLPGLEVSNSVAPLISAGSYPTFTGSNCLLPAPERCRDASDCGDSSKYSVGHGAVVQERRDRPDAVQRARLVDQFVAHRDVLRIAAARPRGVLFRRDLLRLEETWCAMPRVTRSRPARAETTPFLRSPVSALRPLKSVASWGSVPISSMLDVRDFDEPVAQIAFFHQYFGPRPSL